jgi:HEAT repeat protein
MSQERNDVATAVQGLLDALRSPEAPVRLSAAQGLAERGAESRAAVGALLHTSLHDDDPAVRLAAAVALARIDRREKAVVPLLIRALKEGDDGRRWIAADCLAEIGPVAREAVPVLEELLTDLERPPLVRHSFEVALRRLTPEQDR